MPILVPLSSLAVVAGVLLLVWAVAGVRNVRPAASGNLLSGAPTADMRQAQLTRSARERTLQPLIGALARRARRLTPAGFVDSLERRIALAGRPAAWPLERVLAAKLLLGLAGAGYGLFRFAFNPVPVEVAIAAGAATLAFFLPDLLLARSARQRQAEIRLQLPDVLDQMTICVQAGLGFEAAMARAATRGKGAMAQELTRTLQDMQVGLSRGDALRKLAARSEVTELRRFVTALLQAERYGLSITKVLEVQAGELRADRRTRAEERAMKIPVKIVFPVILCLLPALFVVLLGPAGLRMARSFAQF